MAESGGNTKSAKKEMVRALKNERTLKDKVKNGDCSIMCLLIWFFVVVVMLFVDIQMSQDTIPY